ncbi:MAG: hypothetical protein M1828_000832 [Chrysothrix sp. TS-e1954]|nr:MAG: hypothetical protein M1828_000832 [Chrysothrix sp. TS-e1954]
MQNSMHSPSHRRASNSLLDRREDGPAVGPRPVCYVSRGFNILVPLIAVDDLPYDINIKGIPRAVSAHEAKGMRRIGHYSASDVKYTLTPEPQQFLSKNTIQMNGASGGAMGQTDVSNMCEAPSWAEARAQTPAHERHNIYQPSAIGAYGPLNRPPPPSGLEPDPSRKQYCTYWMRTGECDFEQQGCRYKHEMPSLSMLAQIGFRGYPKWFEDRRAAHSAQNGSSWGSKFRPLTRQLPPEETSFKVPSRVHNRNDTVAAQTPQQGAAQSRRSSTTSDQLIDFPALEPQRVESSHSSNKPQLSTNGKTVIAKNAGPAQVPPMIVLESDSESDFQTGARSNSQQSGNESCKRHVRKAPSHRVEDGLVPLKLVNECLAAAKSPAPTNERDKKSNQRPSKDEKVEKGKRNKSQRGKESASTKSSNSDGKDTPSTEAESSRSNKTVSEAPKAAKSSSKRRKPSKHARQRLALKAALDAEKEKNRYLVEKAGVAAAA